MNLPNTHFTNEPTEIQRDKYLASELASWSVSLQILYFYHITQQNSTTLKKAIYFLSFFKWVVNVLFYANYIFKLLLFFYVLQVRCSLTWSVQVTCMETASRSTQWLTGLFVQAQVMAATLEQISAQAVCLTNGSESYTPERGWTRRPLTLKGANFHSANQVQMCYVIIPILSWPSLNAIAFLLVKDFQDSKHLSLILLLHPRQDAYSC